MRTLTMLRKRAKRFPVARLVELSGVSRRNIYSILNGDVSNPRIDTMAALEKAVVKLESDSIKTKSRQKPAKKQTTSRDKAARSEA